MKLSYSLLTHNETDSLQKLLDFLILHKEEEDEIVILDDFSDNTETRKIIDAYVSIHDIKYEQRHLLKDYAGQKNYLIKMCKGDYIFNLDADEIPTKFLVKNIKSIIKENPTIDLFWVPRVNTVEGLTQQHIDQWRWNVNDKGWVNFPDYQGRIWRNRPNIWWINPVHEVLSGYKEHSYFPAEEDFCFYHPKNISKQEKQNEFYTGIQLINKNEKYKNE
jgi:glycosyltransferase involved in cell wall biosynthesis